MFRCKRFNRRPHTRTRDFTESNFEGANLRKTRRADINLYLDTYVLGKPFVFGALVSPEMASKGGLNTPHFEQLVSARYWTAPAETTEESP